MFPQSHNEMLPLDKLVELASQEHKNYISAKPFAHGVYDDIFSPEILNEIINEFEIDEVKWHKFESKYEKKSQMNHDRSMPPTTRSLIHNLNSEPFLNFLESLTGIKGLIPDPYLMGGGLHQIPTGGKLGVHVDFNVHSIMKVYRRINVLIYLNKDWDETYGGHFELWDDKKGACQKKILPTFNRMAIFSTTSKSFHGHPEPLNCPPERSRRSLALYYYTANERGEQSGQSHSTQFLTKKGAREELTFTPNLTSRLKNKLSRMLGLR
jgi:Rps23 Pro-64 3,4-dihydroxylase Tpa1-like proline 4-hydroxylase